MVRQEPRQSQKEGQGDQGIPKLVLMAILLALPGFPEGRIRPLKGLIRPLKALGLPYRALRALSLAYSLFNGF